MTATLEQLVKVRSQLAEGMMEYFQLVMDAPDRPDLLPAYLGERTRTALYVSPDVLKRERRAEPLAPPSAPGQREDERARRAAEGETRPRTRFAAEAQEIGEEAIYGERERETERRVAWAEERKELGRGLTQRAVVLAPPGQGKSLLTQMTACDLAKEAQEALLTERLSADAVPLPVVVTLNALAGDGVRARATPEEALRRALATALRELDCPEIAVKYLADHAHENRCWLFLDALDEAGDEQALTKLFTALKNWQCRVIITSRPYGYTGRLPFDVTEYRLAPLSDEQARMFVGKWFDGNEGQARMNELLARSPSVQQVSQNPFLLTLLCWVAERRELSQEITRTHLYDRVTRDLLGFPVNGAGQVDDQRANEWLPLLTEIAFTFFQENAGREPISSERMLSLIAASDKRPVPLGLTPIQTANLTPRQQATYLLDELRQKRLLVPLTRDRAAYVAPHRSFLEYFTACALADRANHDGWQMIEALVDCKAWVPEWEETLILLTGRLADPLPSLELLSDAKRDDFFRHRLCLAARCLPELSTQGQREVPLTHSKVEGANDEKLPEITQRIAGEVFHHWWEYGKRSCYFPHINRTLPAIAQSRPATLFPVMLERLHDSDDEVRNIAAIALGRIGQVAAQSEVLTLLVNDLHDRDDKVRFSAANALRQIGQAAAQPKVLIALINDLHDPDDWGRYHAVKVLGQMGPAAAQQEVLTSLVKALRDPDAGMRRGAAEAVGQMGPAAANLEVLAGLVNDLHDPDMEVRRSAAEALGQMGQAAAKLEILTVLVNDLDDWRRVGVSFALGQIGKAAAKPEVLTKLVNDLHDCDAEVRLRATHILGQIGQAAAQPEVLTGLVKALQDMDDQVRRNAAEALGQMGQAAAKPEVLTALVKVLHDPDGEVRHRLVRLLRIFRLHNDLHDPDAEVRHSAARALGQMGQAAAKPEILTALFKALHDQDDWVRGSAAGALGQIGQAAAQPEVLTSLVKMLQDPDDWVRRNAAEALGQMGQAAAKPEVLTVLVNYLHSPNKSVRSRTAEALGQMGQGAAKPEVLTGLVNALYYPDNWVRESAAYALGQMGPTAAKAEVLILLVKALHDPEEGVAIRAAEALGQMGQAAAKPEVLTALINDLQNPKELVRRNAVEALGKMMAQGVRLLNGREGKWEVKTVSELGRFEAGQ